MASSHGSGAVNQQGMAGAHGSSPQVVFHQKIYILTVETLKDLFASGLPYARGLKVGENGSEEDDLEGEGPDYLVSYYPLGYQYPSTANQIQIFGEAVYQKSLRDPVCL